MLELRQHFPLADLLQIAGLARSSFYYQQKALHASDRHCDLKTRIRDIFNRHRGRYGYRRITAELKRQGSGVNHKTVQKLMVAMQLKSLVRPKRYKAFAGAVAETAPNHLQRDFGADQPNEKWVTDVTEFKVNNRKLYLSPVMDLYNREIVSYEIAERPLPTMIESMLTKAFDRLGPSERPMLHSDQGWQYRMPAFRKRLQENGLVQSMSRRGNCLDNAAMESFFGTLKCELFYLNAFESVETLKGALHEYIDYYNADRIKLGLGGLSPIEYRMQAAAAPAKLQQCPRFGGRFRVEVDTRLLCPCRGIKMGWLAAYERPALSAQLFAALELASRHRARTAMRTRGAIYQALWSLILEPPAPTDASGLARRRNAPALVKHSFNKQGSTFCRQSCMLMAVHPASAFESWLCGNSSFSNSGRVNNLLKRHY